MNECLSWASLSDKSAVVEALTAEERLFLRSHPSGCPACASEMTLWEDLAHVLKEPERLTARQRSPEEPRDLRRWLPRFGSVRGFQGRFALGAVATLLVAMAASAALWPRPTVLKEPPQLPQEMPAVAGPRAAPPRLAVDDRALRARSDGAAAVLGAGSPHTSKSHDAASPNAAELLQRARELRASGRYGDASAVYLRLVREYAGSPEARVAQVSVGELQLSQLGDAGAALRSFEAYLSGGGALRQEASYGRVRALQRLGRRNDAQKAAAAFVRAYPNSVQAAALRKEQDWAP